MIVLYSEDVEDDLDAIAAYIAAENRHERLAAEGAPSSFKFGQGSPVDGWEFAGQVKTLWFIC